MANRGSSLLAMASVSLCLFAPEANAQPLQCPSPAPDPPPVTISSGLPVDVCAPVGAAGIPFRFFDDFSWRTFVASVWPAKPGERGVADMARSVGDVSTPLVFETFKSDWEVFQPNGAVPAAWTDLGPVNPCPNVPKLTDGDLVLASFSKFGNLGQAGFGLLTGPLIAQNGTYALFLAAFNRPEFEQILSKKWFLRANLQSVSFAPDAQGNNPIDIKSSWVVVKANVPDPARYYTRRAWVYDLQSNQCRQESVALVGLHIVTKTASRPQWIWSTFEHVDNVNDPNATAPFAFNDGLGTAMPPKNPVAFPPPVLPQQPFNVSRVFPVSQDTQATNAKYRAALKGAGTGVWQFYQLVMTQWPNPGDSPKNPGTPSFTFPGAGASTAFANTTMETFDQRKIQNGCMNCHDSTRSETDFLWALQMNAFPALTGTNASQPQFHVLKGLPEPLSLQRLRKLLQNANSANASAMKKVNK